MSRHFLFALSFFGAVASSVAQERLLATKIYTEPTGLRFYVDGVPYRSVQTFMWPEGSKHTIIMDELEQSWFPGVRNKFTNWTDSTGTLNVTNSTTFSITATPAITSIKGVFSTEYLVRVLFYQCSGSDPSTCRPPGTVTVGSTTSTTDVEQWVAPDTELILQAFPNPGFVFTNWGPPASFSTAFAYRLKVTAPVTFQAIFAAAKRVTLLTDPPFLQVAPDRTPTRTPADMDWGQGTRHVLGAVSPQGDPDDAGKLWVFAGWSNGAAMDSVYAVDNTNIPDTITAKYVRGVRTSFLTSPQGLKLRIEGKEQWPAYNFVWGVGLKYTISAAAEQVDSKGRKHVFKGWSNGGSATQEVTITEEHLTTGFRLTAIYEPQSRLTINTNPPGLPIQVDGQECRGSCTLDRAEGAQIQIAAPANVPISDTSRFEFTNWSDGGTALRTFVFGPNPQTSLTATYRNHFRLVTAAEPGNVASFRLDPSSRDGFYAANTSVTVTAEAQPGYRFRRWEGDLSGSYQTGLVTMTVPRTVRGIFDIVPYADEAGVRNAAGETPEPMVAAGSIASIYGVNLAGAYELGSSNPLSQTIGGVIARIGNRLLPLIFVSPQQINLQVPSDLVEGAYQVGIRWNSYPEVLSTMRVVRNAPGLFHKNIDNKLIAAASREDNRQVLPDSPARRDEVVTLFGTGFGPYERSVPDGFALPADPAFPLADPIEVLVGDTPAEVLWAGGAPGQIGTALVRFRLPQEIAVVDGAASVRVRVNGRESNTVLLPVE
ncbi:MAG: hypothetical protein HY235_24480 [Acidobacteria bacterium]|nr:hypothetical protein [Acidobacteriota bacterium]